MENFEKQLNYTFKDRKLLKNALTHSSYANETKCKNGSNERLEFLGDAVLSIIVAEYIYNAFPEMAEGELTKLRASLVCEKSLSKFSMQLNIGNYLKLGKGEEHNGGHDRPSMLADTFEAVLAAMYIDGGFEVAKKHVLRFILPEISSTHEASFKDYKTYLQEIIQRNPEERLSYVLIGESGPDHNKNFTVEVKLNSNVIATGNGTTKKRAEQDAAMQALELMGIQV